MRRAPWKTLPRHSSCFRAGDYLPWLLRSGTDMPLEAIWRPLLGEVRVLPTPTGRHALWWFLEHCPLQAGDGVALAGYNYYPVVQILVDRGLRPRFVDIEPETLCMDPERLEEELDEGCRMVLVTHMFGHPADMARIGEICRRRGLILFEDCAHAVGTRWKDMPVGVLGDGALFSFGVYKAVNAFGGGMLVLRGDAAGGVPGPPPASESPLKALLDPLVRALVTLLMTPGLYGLTLAPFLALCRRHFPRLYHLLDPSDNDPHYRFDPRGRAPFQSFMAEMVRRQVARLEAAVQQRRARAAGLRERLAGVPGVGWLEGDRHGRANASYLGVRLADARAAAAFLERRGVGCRAGEFLDVSRLPQFAPWAASCPQARKAEEEVLRLPSYPCLGEGDLDRIASTLREFQENP